MRDNPFSPSFSIRPERFYGRAYELDMMRTALGNPDSPNRFLFLTGTRGCGKTSLLHQFALLAKRDMKWSVLESTYRDCLEMLRDYAGAQAATRKATSLSPSISVAGVAVSAFEVGHEQAEPRRAHLAQALVDKLSKKGRKKGLLLIIDEVQKIAERDMEEICHAVQAAKTSGANVALVIAGLPLAYSKIRRYPGCTFIQRMRRYRLGMLGVSDTTGFLRNAFALVPEISVPVDQLDEMAEFSGGHPYLLQLVGNAAYEIAAESEKVNSGVPMRFDANYVREAERRALADYQENVLRNLLIGLRPGSRDYLQAMCAVSDEHSTAHTADVARALGKTLQECSSQRARIIDLQLAEPVGRGLLRFSLPYLPLAFEQADYGVTQTAQDAWIPRKVPW